MENTFDIFGDRKREIEVCYSVLKNLEKETFSVNTKNGSLFLKIMKSNFLLMLYNMIEACIVSGLDEIYEDLKNNKCSYRRVIFEVKKIWSEYRIREIYGPTTERKTYYRRVQKMIDDIIEDEPILLSRNALEISGNLNAREIKKICDNHKIRYHLETDGEALETVRRNRNELAHGDKSFSDCARDLTINDLNKIKFEVETFLQNILDGMRQYYDEKQYMLDDERKVPSKRGGKSK